MGVDRFNKANASLDLKKDDVKSVIGMYQNKEVLFDIFSILATVGIFLWIILFVMSLMGKRGPRLFVPIVGYISLILIIIQTARAIYANIEMDFAQKCDSGDSGNTSVVNDDYVIESTNRFYSILSFVYFYVRTYVTTLVNISVFCLGVFIFHRALDINISKNIEQSWTIGVIRSMTDVDNLFLQILAYLYIAFGFVLYVYIYMSIFVYLSASLLFDGTKYISGLKNTNMMAGILLLFFLIPILYFNDQLTNLWRKLIFKTAGRTNDNDIMFPILNIFTQANVFRFIDLADVKIGHRHVRIFLYGLIMTIVFAFIVLPSYSAERLCSLKALQMHKGLDDEQMEEYRDSERASKEFQARFKFGYFVMVVVVVLFHICEVCVRSILISSDSLNQDDQENADDIEVRKYKVFAGKVREKIQSDPILSDMYLFQALDYILTHLDESTVREGGDENEGEIKDGGSRLLQASMSMLIKDAKSKYEKDNENTIKKPSWFSKESTDISNITEDEIKYALLQLYDQDLFGIIDVMKSSFLDDERIEGKGTETMRKGILLHLLVIFILRKANPSSFKSVLQHKMSYMRDVEEFKNRKQSLEESSDADQHKSEITSFKDQIMVAEGVMISLDSSISHDQVLLIQTKMEKLRSEIKQYNNGAFKVGNAMISEIDDMASNILEIIKNYLQDREKFQREIKEKKENNTRHLERNDMRRKQNEEKKEKKRKKDEEMKIKKDQKEKEKAALETLAAEEKI